MAKKSAVNRKQNEMVKRLAKQYAAKRAALKATANNESLPLEDRFEARLKLAKLPRNPRPRPASATVARSPDVRGLTIGS